MPCYNLHKWLGAQDIDMAVHWMVIGYLSVNLRRETKNHIHDPLCSLLNLSRYVPSPQKTDEIASQKQEKY